MYYYVRHALYHSPYGQLPIWKNIAERQQPLLAASSDPRMVSLRDKSQPLGVPSDMNGPSSALVAIAPMASTAELYFSIVSPVVN
jgi:hypothetical protein